MQQKSKAYIIEDLLVRLTSLKASPYDFLYLFEERAVLPGFDLVHKMLEPFILQLEHGGILELAWLSKRYFIFLVSFVIGLKGVKCAPNLVFYRNYYVNNYSPD